MQTIEMTDTGTLIKTRRIENNLAIEDVVKALNIKKNSLLAIEANQIDYFTSKAYYNGFTKEYLKFLGLNPMELNIETSSKDQTLAINIPETEKFNPSFFLALITLLLCIIVYNICSYFINIPIW